MKTFRRLRFGVPAALLLLAVTFSVSPRQASALTFPTFAAPSFSNTWQRTDKPVFDNAAERSWYWGAALSKGLNETYSNATGGQRLVQYFEKSRMEINNTQTNYVTNGLLTVEMITGKLQTGDTDFVKQSPANLPVVGDTNNTFPKYADLASLYNKVQPDNNVGQPVPQRFKFGIGSVWEPAYASDTNTKIATIQNNMGIPTAFWNFLNRTGPIYANGKLVNDKIGDWLYTTGLPIAEAYWVTVKVGGAQKDVLFQPFERRVLTYTPSNSAAWQVEMGNIGSAYVKWRYADGLPGTLPTNPLIAQFTDSKAAWYTD